MSKDRGDKKITGVTSTKGTKTVEGTEQVGAVTGVKATTGIGATQGVGGIQKRGATRTMSLAEREHLFNMVDEEAKKLFGNTVSPEKRKLVEDAVKMAIDSGLVEDGAADNKKK